MVRLILNSSAHILHRGRISQTQSLPIWLGFAVLLVFVFVFELPCSGNQVSTI